MIELTCQNCNKPFYCYISQYNNGRRKYCSNQCRHEARGKQLRGIRPIQLIKEQRIIICAFCGKEFHPKTKKVKYCSIQCSNKGRHIGKIKRFKTYSRKRTDKFSSIDIPCSYCGKILSIQKHRAKRLNHHFCHNNKICYRAWLRENRTGKNHPSFGKKPSIKAGRGKGGFIPELGHYVRSTWEANIARWLVRNNIQYIYEPETFIYENFSYTPDFFTPYNNQYIEVKGWWSKDDRIKVDRFLKDGHNLWIIDKIEYSRLGFNPSETRNSYNSKIPSSTNS